MSSFRYIQMLMRTIEESESMVFWIIYICLLLSIGSVFICAWNLYDLYHEE